jgi:hypothetical protein
MHRQAASCCKMLQARGVVVFSLLPKDGHFFFRARSLARQKARRRLAQGRPLAKLCRFRRRAPRVGSSSRCREKETPRTELIKGLPDAVQATSASERAAHGRLGGFAFERGQRGSTRALPVRRRSLCADDGRASNEDAADGGRPRAGPCRRRRSRASRCRWRRSRAGRCRWRRCARRARRAAFGVRKGRGSGRSAGHYSDLGGEPGGASWARLPIMKAAKRTQASRAKGQEKCT